jgi:hypothetical protein
MVARLQDPMERSAAGSDSPTGGVALTFCNFTLDEGTGQGFKKGVLRGGTFFYTATPATDPAATASVAGCAALCCATGACRAFSLSAPWSLGTSSGPGSCQQGQNCCSLSSSMGPMRNNTYQMNITTGVVKLTPSTPCGNHSVLP